MSDAMHMPFGLPSRTRSRAYYHSPLLLTWLSDVFMSLPCITSIAFRCPDRDSNQPWSCTTPKSSPRASITSSIYISRTLAFSTMLPSTAILNGHHPAKIIWEESTTIPSLDYPSPALPAPPPPHPPQSPCPSLPRLISSPILFRTLIHLDLYTKQASQKS